ncbi:MAG: hypothetical protein HWE09_00760 [Cyclobacteriaceae bacterium]|uniref:DUF6090 family protein n=1 Tax=Algoriphagus sp. TaxID=1872435 RepID=UPI0017E194BC|nr:DUF6090 family protein [Algoriphagus sp.]NVJ85114.1 hypothetical protein [Algoriphagus sp.]NVK48265.1 hypothetical protein [Cyclobacteriaceae bacterium]
MISFFRKIRQKLLQQNRVSRYLAYALGEILLVVIGILIALQVNNWNENLKIREKEKLFLERIKEEALWNIDILDNQIKIYQQNASNLDSVAFALNNDLPKNEHLRIPASPFFISAWRLRNSAYTELVSSGSLGILSDIKLREILDEAASFQSITIQTLNYWRDMSVADINLFQPYRIQEIFITNGDTTQNMSLDYDRMKGQSEVIAGIQFWSLANRKFAGGILEFREYFQNILDRIECLENKNCPN